MGGERARDLLQAIMYDADVFHIGLGIVLFHGLAWLYGGVASTSLVNWSLVERFGAGWATMPTKGLEAC